MLFNSYSFLIFFPIVVILYYLIPKKIRYIWLLICSYYFYMGWNAKYALLLLTSTMLTYVGGILLHYCKKGRKFIVASGVIANLAILFLFKYFDFAVENINAVLGAFGIELLNPEFDVILPVGISFYIFQALGYLIDVYRGDIGAEKNPFRYALFVSFFPQLVAGPIERSKNLLNQLRETHKFEYRNLCEGLLLMIWGYFMKMVIADRLAIFINAAFGHEVMYDGRYLLIANIMFAIQVYCDFAGYSVIAMGAAKVMGFTLMENFDCPYYSESVTELWRRWHISLASWFKDYLYIPLGGSKKGRIRKYINIMIVFVVSGLWHGANWTYVVWGGLNGVYQVIGDLLKPVKKKLYEWLPFLKKNFGMKLVRIAFTFVLVNFSHIFFRADSLSHAFDIIKRIVHMNNPLLLANGGLYDLGLNEKNFAVALIAIAILLIADLFKYNGIRIRNLILDSWLIIRWPICIAAVLAVIVFGVWGSGYEQTSFIYFQF